MNKVQQQQQQQKKKKRKKRRRRRRRRNGHLISLALEAWKGDDGHDDGAFSRLATGATNS
jgi:hypothetical protein